MTTMTAAEFNRAPSSVKRRVLESEDPIVVTDRDRPTLVVMKYKDYLDLTTSRTVTNVAEFLAMEDDIDFEPPRVGLGLQEVNL